jgi:hypothetical protein
MRSDEDSSSSSAGIIVIVTHFRSSVPEQVASGTTLSVASK